VVYFTVLLYPSFYVTCTLKEGHRSSPLSWFMFRRSWFRLLEQRIFTRIEVSSWMSLLSPAGGRILPQIKLLALPSLPFPIHNSVLSLPFEAVYNLSYWQRPEK